MSLYWAIATITTTGYGDVTATTHEEVLVLIICCAGVAGLWSYIVGGVCGAVQTLTPHDDHYRAAQDDLNTLIEQCSMVQDTRERLRAYYHEAKFVARKRSERYLMDQMSPALQGETALAAHAHWVKRVPFLHGLSQTHIVLMMQKLEIIVYTPKERLDRDRTLFVIKAGVCMRDFRMLRAGDCWGMDMLLENAHLRERKIAISISYLHCLLLSAQDFQCVLHMYPEVGHLLIWKRMKMCLTVAIPKLSKALKKVKSDPGMNQCFETFGGKKRGQLYAAIINETVPPGDMLRPVQRQKSQVTYRSAATLLKDMRDQMSYVQSTLDDIRSSQLECVAEMKQFLRVRHDLV